MKSTLLGLLLLAIFVGGCASKQQKPGFDQRSYDRQNSAAREAQSQM